MSRRRKLGQGQIDIMRDWLKHKEQQRVELLDAIGRLGRYAIGTQRYNDLKEDLRDCLEAIAYYTDCVSTGYTD